MHRLLHPIQNNTRLATKIEGAWHLHPTWAWKNLRKLRWVTLQAIWPDPRLVNLNKFSNKSIPTVMAFWLFQNLIMLSLIVSFHWLAYYFVKIYPKYIWLIGIPFFALFVYRISSREFRPFSSKSTHQTSWRTWHYWWCLFAMERLFDSHNG